MEKNIELKRNINKNYIFILLKNIDFTRGIWMLYLAAKGMSLIQLGLLETIYHIASFTMEVPTGAVADIFGRKTSRTWGRIASLLSVILLLISKGFPGFAISFIFSALSNNLESGAGDALLYDSLKEIGEEKSYMKIAGRSEVFLQTAGIISYLLGGFLAAKSYNIAFTLTLILGSLTVLQSLSFEEPVCGKTNMKKVKKNMFIRQLKESAGVILGSSRVIFLILFSQMISAFCTAIFFYMQNYLKGNGYNEAEIGAVYAASSLLAAFTAPQVHNIEKRIKEQGLLLILPFITVACIFGVALSRFEYVFFILLMITESMTYVTMSDYINKIIPSEYRATILSFDSMVFSLFMITVFPLMGVIGERISLSAAFKSMAVIGSVLLIINTYILMIKRRNKA